MFFPHEIRHAAPTRFLLTAAALFALLAPAGAAAQALTVEHTVEFSLADFTFDQRFGYDLVRLGDEGHLAEPGRPLLPNQTLRIALPAGMAVSGVRVVESQSLEVPGRFVVFPAQPPRRISDSTSVEFMPPDEQAYASTEPYPARLAEVSHQADLAGQGLAVVRVYPLQYVASEEKLVLHTSVRLVLEGEAGYVCGDYLPQAASEHARAVYERMITEMVVNPQDVVLRTSGRPLGMGRGVEPGRADYVIITKSEWIDAFAPLAEWKTKKGVRATIVDRDWIYATYGDTAYYQKIRSFVRDAHTNWGAIYFLLGGDTDTIPPHWRSINLPGYGVESVPNDTYYADYDGDWICEVHVGRASVRNADAVTTFVNKVLTYEKNPPLTDYAKTAFFMGFDAWAYGSAEGENCKIDIAAYYLPADWTYRSEYDSYPGTHKQNCINYLNQGNNLVNHIDHSSTTVMGVGSVNHGEYLTNDDMTALHNGARQSILYTVGCWACNYIADTCVGEAFVRNPNGGGIAFIGNTRYGWYSPYQSDGLSMRYDRYFFRSLFNQGHYRLGVCFSNHKHDAYQNDQYMRYIFTGLTLLGDPELPIWTEQPQTLTASYADSLETGLFTDFPVYVSYDDAAVPGATVCLWKDGDVYEVAQTDASGTATFWFAPLSTGPMAVTAWKHNHLAYEGETQVVDGVPPYTLTVLAVGSGSVERDPPAGPYDSGTPVQLTAIPDPLWCFYRWEGSVDGSANPETIIMDGHKIVTAVFEPDCNGNGVPDWIDLADCPPDDPDCQDCNGNGVLDWCDIHVYGTSMDCQPNGIPDECELYVPPHVEAQDNCADARIVCPGRVYYGSTIDATNEGSASCGDSATTPDMWYYYKPLTGGQLTISLAGSSYDTVLSVHTGVPGTVDNELGCNDDYFGQQSRLQVIVQQHGRYWIRISGDGGATGDFQMTLAGPACDLGTDCNGNGVPDDCDIADGTSTDLNGNGVPDECEGLGDLNCDNVVDDFDIQPFILALINPAQYQADYPGCDIMRADINGDGVIDGFDIQGFVQLLTHR